MSSPTPPSTLAGLSPLKLAVLARQVRAQSEAVLRADPIAIVGMGCRLPGGVANPDDFWQLLRDGVDAVCEVPPGRWDADASYDPDPSVPGKAATKSGGFLGAIDGFDAAYFGILPREAERMDPQQRLFLEVAIEALDHAGLPRERLAGSRTGVFIASYHNDYAQLEYNDPQAIDARTLTGTVHSVLANRLSYLLDLRGPSISIDTACSSSLVAIHMACQSLRYGESDIAVAGGVSLMVTDGLMISLSKVGFMAPDGRCKTFDASADGFGRGEGCSVIVLKRLSDAIADGDRVLALVRGSAVNQDGHSTVLAAPNGLAQQALIREALDNAQIDGSRIGYVEAHGTGTALGDPIEVEALAATIGQPAADAGPCLIGAAKANIGHLEAAAGVTGVIKSVLVLQHGEVPPQVHFRSLNPHISLAGSRLQIPTRRTPWPAGAQPRCIGTSGFGVGGTNAHVILEEAPRLGAEPAGETANPPFLLPLSAQSPAALRALVQRWIDFLPGAAEPLSALCATASERRSHYDHRVAAVAGTTGEMLTRLQAYLDDAAPSGWASGRRGLAGPVRLAFVFGGQGQQWIGMGRELLAQEPVFRAALADVDARLRRHVPWSLLDELAAPEASSRLAETEVAQPAIFALQVALAAQWAHWGVRPDGVVGHSIGEIAALHVAGALSLDDAVRIVVHRARAMQRATGLGAMATIGLSEAQARELIRGFGARLSVGAVNSPQGVVLSGEPQPLAEVLRTLDTRGIAHRSLPVNYAFHSAQMIPFADELERVLGPVRADETDLPIYSTVSGRRIGAQAVDAAYFGRNVREPVRFADAITAMGEDGFTAFLEIGAHPVLGPSIAECLAGGDEPLVQLASLRRGRPERESLLLACAGLYATARPLDWPALHGKSAAALDLPAYPWQRERFWLRERPAASAPASHVPPGTPSMLGQPVHTAAALVFESRWPNTAPAWLADHRVAGQLVVPGTALLEALRAAAAEALGQAAVEVLDFVLHQALLIDEGTGATTTWQVVVDAPVDATVGLTVHQAAPAGDGHATGWSKVASARARRVDPALDLAQSDAALAPAGPNSDAAEQVAGVYDAFAALGVAFGAQFRTLRGLSMRPGGVTAWLQRTGADEGPAALHPAVLDGALQACVAAADGGVPKHLRLPLGVDRFSAPGPVPASLRLEASLEREPGRLSLSADLRLFDARGTLVARLDGVRFVPTSAAALGAQRRSDPWLHELAWQPLPEATARAAAPVPNPGAWMILCDAGGTGDALAARLDSQGVPCLRLERPAQPPSAAQLAARLADVSWRRDQPLAGVVHLWSLDEPRCTEIDRAPEALADDDELGAISALAVVQAMARHTEPAGRLVLVTAGAQAAGAGAVLRPAAAGLWGLAGVIAVEHPELDVLTIDLDGDAPVPDTAALAEALAAGRTGPRRLAVRGSQRLVPKLQQRAAPALVVPPVRLAVGATRTLDGLHWEAGAAQAPGPDQVRLRVVAAGLNFRDVLMALGMVPGIPVSLGAECAGVVESVGSTVTGLRPGDAVFGFAPDSLATEVTVPAAFVARWPSELGPLEIAAAQPAAYLTALLGLHRLAGLKAGQRVLIHAAAGGVGMAAVQLAQRAGAIVFATAGSESKRALLRRLGVAHVFDSRSLAFADGIRELTAGEGVDVVLNSLAGDFIGASVGVLARRGCFLELGKRDLWTEAQFHAMRPDASYRIYDLGQQAHAERGLLGPLLAELLAALADGSLRPLPVRVFDFAQAADAFRFMAQARHTGKLVLRAPQAATTTAPLLRPDATYWVTGGLGALGLHTARWLVNGGARHLVLSGRHAPGAAARAVLQDLEAQGATLLVRAADAGDVRQMRALLDEIAATLPPLRGVVHAAGALDDGVLLQQDTARFAQVLRGKAQGARILDALTRGLPLDFFVLYSAAGQLLGPAGQGPYAAANAELDALAHARRSAGLPALSVAWGLWREGGMAATMTGPGADIWTARGLAWIDTAPAFDRLERLLREGATQAAVLPIDWSRFRARLPAGLEPAFFPAPAGTETAPGAIAAGTPAARAEQWLALPGSQRRSAVLAHVGEQALQVLGLAPTTLVEPRLPLKEIGLDSLMAVELRNALTRSIGRSLPATLLFDHPSLEALTLYLMRTLKLDDTAAVAVPTPPAGARDAVAALSDAEAEAQLLAELDGPADRSRP